MEVASARFIGDMLTEWRRTPRGRVRNFVAKVKGDEGLNASRNERPKDRHPGFERATPMADLSRLSTTRPTNGCAGTPSVGTVLLAAGQRESIRCMDDEFIGPMHPD